jgi:hypothetical protein
MNISILEVVKPSKIEKEGAPKINKLSRNL